MTTQEYLSQISRLNRVINNKTKELLQLRELATSVSSVKNEERVQTTPNFDKIGAAYCKISSLEEKIENLVDKYIKIREKIIKEIESIEDETEYQVLFSHYIVGEKLEKISQDMNYVYRNITRLHGKAIKNFEKKYGNEYLSYNVLECPIENMIQVK